MTRLRQEVLGGPLSDIDAEDCLRAQGRAAAAAQNKVGVNGLNWIHAVYTTTKKSTDVCELM